MSTPEAVVAKALAGLGIKPPEGWEAMDPTSPENRENKARNAIERFERAKVIADGVSDEALLMMQELTLDAATFNVPDLGLINALGFGVWREGQNALVRWIKQQKQIAAQGPGGDAPVRKSKRTRS